MCSASAKFQNHASSADQGLERTLRFVLCKIFFVLTYRERERSLELESQFRGGLRSNAIGALCERGNEHKPWRGSRETVGMALVRRESFVANGCQDFSDLARYARACLFRQPVWSVANNTNCKRETWLWRMGGF